MTRRGIVPATRDGRGHALRYCADCGRQCHYAATRCRPCKEARRIATTAATAVERFEAMVDRSAGPDACWPWLGVRQSAGYPQFYRGSGIRMLATHMALELDGRPLAPGMWALHRCDNPPCVNPGHLFAGTHADNMRDMVAKGRQAAYQHPDRVPRGDKHGSHLHPESRARGERHGSRTHPERVLRGEAAPRALLTDAKVREIRSALANGQSSASLGRTYGVTESAIGRLKRGLTWRHVA